MPTIIPTTAQDVQKSMATTDAMLAQTKAQGSTPFAGSSYDAKSYGYTNADAGEIAGAAGVPTPQLIVTGSSAMKQFNDQSSGINNIIAEKNTNLNGGTGTGGTGTGTGGTTGSGGTGGTTTTKEEKEKTKTETTETEDPYVKMAKEAEARSLAQAEENKRVLDEARANLSAESQALVDSINSSYDVKVKAQSEANDMLQGIMRKQGFMGGAVMASSGVQDPALADSMQRGMDKVSALNTERNQLIAQAKMAQKKSDLALTSASYDALQKNEDALNETILKISKQAEDEKQAAITEKRNAENDVRAAQDQEIQLAGTLAKGLRAKLQGLDDKSASTIIQKTAKDYNLDPGILMSAYSDYDLTASGKESVMATREATQKLAEERLALQTEKAAKGNSSDLFPEYSKFFSPTTKLKGGVPVLDKEGFVTPVAWQYAISKAATDGIKRADFIKEFGHYLGTGGNIQDIPNSYGLSSAEKKIVIGALPAGY